MEALSTYIESMTPNVEVRNFIIAKLQAGKGKALFFSTSHLKESHTVTK